MITVRTLCRVSGGYVDRCRAGDITCMPRGVCRQVLKLRAAWEGSPGKAAAANPPEAEKSDYQLEFHRPYPAENCVMLG
jgi:hypothetical protein